MQEEINLSQIAGPIYMGILFNLVLYGVLVVQIYIYYGAFNNDHKTVKLLVYGLFALDTLQSILLIRDGFITFAAGFGKIQGLNEAHLEWISIPLITAIVSCIVQCFFASRIFILSEKSYWIPVAIVATSLTQGIAAIMAGVKDFKLQLYSLLQTEAVVEITVWHVATAVCDVLIAGSMSYYLWKRDTGIQKTHEIIVKLIQLTIETGTATATLAIVDLALFLGAPGKIYFVTPSFIAAKLYANTIVVIFNNRAQITSTSRSTLENAIHSADRSRGYVMNRISNRVNLADSKRGATNYVSDIEIQKSVSVWEDDGVNK